MPMLHAIQNNSRLLAFDITNLNFQFLLLPFFLTKPEGHSPYKQKNEDRDFDYNDKFHKSPYQGNRLPLEGNDNRNPHLGRVPITPGQRLIILLTQC